MARRIMLMLALAAALTARATHACTTAANCPGGQSCNTVTGTCEAACGDANHTACSSGCCDGSTNTCAQGLAVAACGLDGGTCAVCSGATPVCSDHLTATGPVAFCTTPPALDFDFVSEHQRPGFKGPGHPWTGSVRVRNIGTAAVPSFRMTYLLFTVIDTAGDTDINDGQQQLVTPTSGLGVNRAYTHTWNGISDGTDGSGVSTSKLIIQPGNYKFEACVNQDVSNPSDFGLCRFMTFNIPPYEVVQNTPGPQLDIGPWGFSPKQYTFPAPGKTIPAVTFHAQFVNVGGSGTGTPADGFLMIDGNLVAEGTTPKEIPSGGTGTITTLKWTPPAAGNYTVVLCAGGFSNPDDCVQNTLTAR